MPFQPTLPTWLALNACNDTSPTGFTDLRTGQVVYAGGLNLGDYFDLTNGEAANLSYTTNGILYEGRYRRVQVDSGATAANVKTGTIGLMPSLAAVIADGDPAGKPTANIVTSLDQGIGQTPTIPIRPVVFLNTVTPGNFCFVQELGFANVLGKSGGLTKATPAQGDLINVIAAGVVDDPTSQSIIPATIGYSIDLPKSGGVFRVLLTNVPILQG
jgi:hypothetical protein